MKTLTRKASVILLGILGAAALVVSGSRVWVSGTVDDAVLGASRISGRGSDVASGIVALALVAGAAAIATTTSGRVLRRVTVTLLALATIGLALVTVHVLTDPSAALGAVAARSTGRTGRVDTHATTTGWPWVALLATAVLALATVAGFLGSRRWQGLSSRYEAPDSGGDIDVRGARGERVTSDWDRLSAGDDPTETDPPRT